MKHTAKKIAAPAAIAALLVSLGAGPASAAGYERDGFDPRAIVCSWIPSICR